jgi:hypothetical protein
MVKRRDGVQHDIKLSTHYDVKLRRADIESDDLVRTVLWIEPRTHHYADGSANLYNCVVIRTDGSLGQFAASKSFLASLIWGGDDYAGRMDQ